MDYLQLTLITVAIGLVALLYSSVGHAGASGYIAVMALAGFADAQLKPTALVLNILVASIGAVQFYRAGHFSWSLFWPFALLSIPAAFWGGAQKLPPSIFKPLVGVVLLFSAGRLLFRRSDPTDISPPNRFIALTVGAVIGLLSGLTGTGGGIFLTPLMLFCRWATTRQAAATSVLFILVNSIAGLSGYQFSGETIPPFTIAFALAAITGGTVGSYLGSKRLPIRGITLLLATVLIIAGTKLLLSR